MVGMLHQDPDQALDLGPVVGPAWEDLDLDEELRRRETFRQILQARQGRRYSPSNPDLSTS
jgi:hypothetical protein